MIALGHSSVLHGIHTMLLCRMSMQLRENWLNDMRIYPESAPVWARLPLGNLTGYAAYMEVRFVLDDGSSGTWICLT